MDIALDMGMPSEDVFWSELRVHLAAEVVWVKYVCNRPLVIRRYQAQACLGEHLNFCP